MKINNKERMLISVMILCFFLLASFSACAPQKAVDKSPELASDNPLEKNISAESLPNKANLPKEALRFKDGPFAGQAIPADIKGSYTLTDTAFIYQVPLDVLGEAFMIPPQYIDQVRHVDLKQIYRNLALVDKELGNGSVIMFVSLYKGMPYEPHEPTYQLEMGAQILKQSGKLSPEQEKYLDEHTVLLSEIGQVYFDFLDPSTGQDPNAKPPLASEDPSMIGVLRIDAQTTFQDVLDVGISQRILLEIVGAEKIEDLNQSIRSYCVLKGLQFSAVKDRLNQLLD
jgi:hypothetical protein